MAGYYFYTFHRLVMKSFEEDYIDKWFLYSFSLIFVNIFDCDKKRNIKNSHDFTT